ncbi:hypothetical protein SAMN05880582_101209 [Rhizobium sp. RU20A]|uniref:hypothetical protein n=1 Tax=Rhizobium sp. RU20A TaxID=1907412 RepID=UPI0009569C86|nr:hypothetical protein [Rhizobium sp. RU20A]SIP96946.1 hypothetical protein SAMN05880582_101209 [Rhizobium sp. RU20A]
MSTALNRMTVKELPPGQWTELDTSRFQIREQNVLRLALGTFVDNQPSGFPEYEPPAVDTDAYFLTPGYGDVPVSTLDYFGRPGCADREERPIYAMPNGVTPVTIVMIDYSAKPKTIEEAPASP